MTRTSTIAGLFGLAAIAATTTSVQAGPSMSTNWQSTTLSQQECMRRAERVMRDAGMNRNFEIVGQSVFGEREVYTAQVRCITEKGIVVFVVAGSGLDGARNHLNKLVNGF